MNGFSITATKPIIIATKLDKLKRSQIQKHLKMIKEGLQLKKGSTVIPFQLRPSREEDEIWEVIEALNRQQRAF